MYDIYISSFGNKNLSCGAAESIKKFSIDTDIKITLIDMSKTIYDGPFDNIVHHEGMRWMGWSIAKKIHENKSNAAICIDASGYERPQYIMYELTTDSVSEMNAATIRHDSTRNHVLSNIYFFCKKKASISLHLNYVCVVQKQ